LCRAEQSKGEQSGQEQEQEEQEQEEQEQLSKRRFFFSACLPACRWFSFFLSLSSLSPLSAACAPLVVLTCPSCATPTLWPIAICLFANVMSKGKQRAVVDHGSRERGSSLLPVHFRPFSLSLLPSFLRSSSDQRTLLPPPLPRSPKEKEGRETQRARVVPFRASSGYHPGSPSLEEKKGVMGFSKSTETQKSGGTCQSHLFFFVCLSQCPHHNM